jgi:hypothetical protein
MSICSTCVESSERQKTSLICLCVLVTHQMTVLLPTFIGLLSPWSSPSQGWTISESEFIWLCVIFHVLLLLWPLTCPFLSMFVFFLWLSFKFAWDFSEKFQRLGLFRILSCLIRKELFMSKRSNEASQSLSYNFSFPNNNWELGK